MQMLIGTRSLCSFPFSTLLCNMSNHHVPLPTQRSCDTSFTPVVSRWTWRPAMSSVVKAVWLYSSFSWPSCCCCFPIESLNLVHLSIIAVIILLLPLNNGRSSKYIIIISQFAKGETKPRGRRVVNLIHLCPTETAQKMSVAVDV